MNHSRLARVQERREKNRLAYALFGIIAVIIFLAFFGLKMLVGFSLLVDKIRGGSPQISQNESLLLAPILNPLPQSTNSAELVITGTGQKNTTLVLYVNDTEAKKLSLKDSDIFAVSVKLSEGQNSIQAQVTDEKGNTSEFSSDYNVQVKKSAPLLEISQPTDGAKITGEKNTILVSGHTEEETKVTINGRLAILATDGSFHMTISIPEGDSTITIIATDLAGNQTLIERKVNYQR